MNEAIRLTLVFAAGGALGALFFGALWWTVRKGVASQRSDLWFVGSLLVRTGIVLSGFYVVTAGHWERLAACLVGFVIARRIAMKLIREKPAYAAAENGDAPEP